MITVLFLCGIVFLAYGYCGTLNRGAEGNFRFFSALSAAAFHAPFFSSIILFSASAGNHFHISYSDSFRPVSGIQNAGSLPAGVPFFGARAGTARMMSIESTGAALRCDKKRRLGSGWRRKAVPGTEYLSPFLGRPGKGPGDR